MGITFQGGDCDVAGLAGAEGRSLEDAGRQARLRFLEEVRGRVGASRVALGHTRSDQAETLLLRLFRGSGRGGLGAMRPVRDGLWIRPLLEVSRGDVERYLAFRSLSFRRDASNREVRFTRNRIRRDLLPRIRREYNPDVEGTLARTAEVLGAEESLLEGLVQEAYLRAKRAAPAGKIVLDIQRALGYHVALRRRMVRRALTELGSSSDGLAFDVVERIVEGLDRPIYGIRTSSDVEVFRTPDALIFSRRIPPFDTLVRVPGRTIVPRLGIRVSVRIRQASEVQGTIGAAGPDEAFLDVRSITEGVQVRNPRRGDRFRPLGMSGTKRVSDLLADAKVPRPLRDSVPIFTSGGAILWVAGHRLSHHARVTGRTRQVVHLRVRRQGIADGTGGLRSERRISPAPRPLTACCPK